MLLLPYKIHILQSVQTEEFAWNTNFCAIKVVSEILSSSALASVL